MFCMHFCVWSVSLMYLWREMCSTSTLSPPSCSPLGYLFFLHALYSFTCSQGTAYGGLALDTSDQDSKGKRLHPTWTAQFKMMVAAGQECPLKCCVFFTFLFPLYLSLLYLFKIQVEFYSSFYFHVPEAINDSFPSLNTFYPK